MHVILYVLDALRADHLGCYGYERDTSPAIDKLSRVGVLFDNCFTSSTWTRPVAASILTGTYPGAHKCCRRDDMLTSNITRLPQILKKGGFKTVAFSTMGNVASDIGFDVGFDQYYDLFRDPDIMVKRRGLDPTQEALMHGKDERIALPRAEDINRFLLKWLKENRESNSFCFVWSIETHVPYSAPFEFRKFSQRLELGPKEGERDDIRSAGAEDRVR